MTLEDIGYILGLPILGELLVEPPITNVKAYFSRNWFEVLNDDEVKDAWGKEEA